MTKRNGHNVCLDKGPQRGQAALLLAKSRSYQDAADATSTRKAYGSDFKRFKGWCAANGFEVDVIVPETVGAYLAASGEGFAKATLRRWVAAIARESALKGHPLDTRHPAIRETLRGIARRHGGAGRRSAALTTEEVKVLCRIDEGSLPGLRDRALFLVGFAGALRRSELVGLDVEHVKWGGFGLILRIVKSKTDKLGEGEEVSIPYGRDVATCPVRALRAWVKGAPIKSGPIFRKIGRGGKVQSSRLKGDGVRQILLKRATAAGITGTRMEPISPHGLRAGFITTAYANGVPDEEIMGHTRHRSQAVMRKYVRRSKLSRSSPAGKVGL